MHAYSKVETLYFNTKHEASRHLILLKNGLVNGSKARLNKGGEFWST